MDNMTRSCKNPEQRKKEFVDMARTLFAEKGFEHTSIDDIVSGMGVAKGLFYYYFKTKDDVIFGIVEEMLAEVEADLDVMVAERYDSALDQMEGLFCAYVRMNNNSYKILDLFHERRNQEFRNYFIRNAKALFRDAIIKTIERGLEEGIFNVRYVPETADMLLSVSSALFRDPPAEDPEANKEMRGDIAERLLGMPSGTYMGMRSRRS